MGLSFAVTRTVRFKNQGDERTTMVSLDPPQERRCLRCGRLEVWNDERTAWVAKRDGGEPQRGRKHCVHEWDTTGRYNAISS